VEIIYYLKSVGEKPIYYVAKTLITVNVTLAMNRNHAAPRPFIAAFDKGIEKIKSRNPKYADLLKQTLYERVCWTDPFIC